MVLQTLNRGNYVNDPSADTAYDGAGKIIDNFADLYQSKDNQANRLDAIEAAGWVTVSRLVNEVLPANSTGLAKMADGYLAASAPALAKMAAGFFAGSTDALAKFADGFWTATTAARAKFADGIWTNAKLANMANGTVKARGSVGAGASEDLTGAQFRDQIMAAGAFVDEARDTYANNVDIGAPYIPLDDTKPQIGEGTQILTKTITPKSITNKVKANVEVYGSCAAGAHPIIVALYRNGGTDSISTAIAYAPAANQVACVTLEFEDSPGSVSAQAYTVRVAGSAATIRLNGSGAARLFGGTLVSSLTLTEIKA